MEESKADAFAAERNVNCTGNRGIAVEIAPTWNRDGNVPPAFSPFPSVPSVPLW